MGQHLRNNTEIIGIPEREEKKKAESLFEGMMSKNFFNLTKETDIQIRDAQRVPNKTKPKRSIQRHIIIKITELKVKDRENLKKQHDRNNLLCTREHP